MRISESLKRGLVHARLLLIQWDYHRVKRKIHSLRQKKDVSNEGVTHTSGLAHPVSVRQQVVQEQQDSVQRMVGEAGLSLGSGHGGPGSVVKVGSNGWSTAYYEIPEGAVELQDLIEHKDMNFAVGNIFKSAYRLGGKEGINAEYDLNKIIWFAKRELKKLGETNGT